jgi:hypothetical protein
MNCPQCGGQVRKQIRVYLDLPAHFKVITKSLIRQKEVSIVGALGQLHYCCNCTWRKEVYADGTTIRGKEKIRF